MHSEGRDKFLKGDLASASLHPTTASCRGGRQQDDALAGEVRDLVKQQLSATASPRIIRFVDALPLTSTGKVDRRRLLEQHESLAATRRSASDPQEPRAGSGTP